MNPGKNTAVPARFTENEAPRLSFCDTTFDYVQLVSASLFIRHFPADVLYELGGGLYYIAANASWTSRSSWVGGVTLNAAN